MGHAGAIFEAPWNIPHGNHSHCNEEGSHHLSTTKDMVMHFQEIREERLRRVGSIVPIPYE